MFNSGVYGDGARGVGSLLSRVLRVGHDLLVPRISVGQVCERVVWSREQTVVPGLCMMCTIYKM